MLCNNGLIGIVKYINPNYYGIEISKGVIVAISKQAIKALVPKGTLKATLELASHE